MSIHAGQIWKTHILNISESWILKMRSRLKTHDNVCSVQAIKSDYGLLSENDMFTIWYTTKSLNWNAAYPMSQLSYIQILWVCQHAAPCMVCTAWPGMFYLGQELEDPFRPSMALETMSNHVHGIGSHQSNIISKISSKTSSNILKYQKTRETS